MKEGVGVEKKGIYSRAFRKDKLYFMEKLKNSQN